MDVPMLADLPDADRRRVIAAAVRRRFGRNEIVFHEGDPGETLHLLVRGHVAIRTTTRLGDVATLTVLGPGASFGELALIGDAPRRTATAAALDGAETLMITRQAFDDLRRRHPSVDRLLVLLLAQRVRRLSDELRDAYYVPANRRVIQRLDELADLYRTDDGAAVVVPISQEALATMAGTTRSTANRVLRDGEREGWLALRRGRVEILDLDAVRHRAAR